MSKSTRLLTRFELKGAARALREELKQAGQYISHTQSLQRIAAKFGFADWQSLVASLPSEKVGRVGGEKVVAASSIRKCLQSREMPCNAVSPYF